MKLKKQADTHEQLKIKQRLNTIKQTKQKVWDIFLPEQSSTKDLCLLDYPPLDILLAFLSPYHIFHTTRSQSGRLMALTHHLQSLNALGPFVHVMRNENDTSFCRHVKDVPVLGIQKNQQKCLQRSRQERDQFCDTLYSINPHIFPRETILKAKGCLTCKDVNKSSHLSKMLYRTLKQNIVKRIKNKKLKKSRVIYS